MEDLITRLESKVKDWNNTTTIFDTRKYVLLEDVKELINEALNIPVIDVPKNLINCKICDKPVGEIMSISCVNTMCDRRDNNKIRIIKYNELKTNRSLSKREIRNELFSILAMTDAFIEEGSMVGGKRKEEMIKYLPKQIASRIISLQDLIEECNLSD